MLLSFSPIAINDFITLPFVRDIHLMHTSMTSIVLTYFCYFFVIFDDMPFVTGRMLRRGKLPVLNLLRPKIRFSPRRGDSLHRFTSNLAQPMGTWVRLAVQNLTSISAVGWECGPQNIKNFHFFSKESPPRANPLTDF